MDGGRRKLTAPVSVRRDRAVRECENSATRCRRVVDVRPSTFTPWEQKQTWLEASLCRDVNVFVPLSKW